MNHEGSAASLEPEGVVVVLNGPLISINQDILNILVMGGGGDIKSYLEVVKKDPYNGTVCIGHLQKRGARLHKMRKDGPFKNMM